VITSPNLPPARRRIMAATAGSVVLVGAIVVGLYALGGDAEPERISPPSLHAVPSLPQEPSGTPATELDERQGLPELRETTDSRVYARSVAEALFTWDTASGLTPRNYADNIIAGSDPSGVETAGLMTDLASYLPADDVWRQLRQYQTKQSLRIESYWVPTAWDQAVDEARGQIPEGTYAVNIRGTRQRDGVWDGQEETTKEVVEFTVFVGCPPRFDDRCYVLRLSQLDNPL
jgi:hypothetical protein